MADTRPDIILPKNIPVDLYAALNAQAGFPSVTLTEVLSVQNKGGTIDVHAGADAPTSTDGTLIVGYSQIATNQSSDAGAWAISKVVDGLINVRVS